MCSTVKVFIPRSIFNQEYNNSPSYLYGHIRQASDHSPTTFYVLDKRSIKDKHSEITFIGEITNEGNRNIDDGNHQQFIRFTNSILHTNILLVDIQYAEQNYFNLPVPHVQIVLFDLHSFQKSAIRNESGSSTHTKDDIEMLQALLQNSKCRNGVLQASKTLANALGSNRILTGIRCCFAKMQSQRVIKDTAVARHFVRWRHTFIMEPLTMYA